MKPQKARQAYIKILRHLSQNPREAELISELIEGNFIVGAVTKDAKGVPNHYIANGITSGGRLFLETLEKEEFEESWKGRALKMGGTFVTFLAGIISGLLIQLFIQAYLTP